MVRARSLVRRYRGRQSRYRQQNTKPSSQLRQLECLDGWRLERAKSGLHYALPSVLSWSNLGLTTRRSLSVAYNLIIVAFVVALAFVLLVVVDLVSALAVPIAMIYAL